MRLRWRSKLNEKAAAGIHVLWTFEFTGLLLGKRIALGFVRVVKP